MVSVTVALLLIAARLLLLGFCKSCQVQPRPVRATSGSHPIEEGLKTAAPVVKLEAAGLILHVQEVMACFPVEF